MNLKLPEPTTPSGSSHDAVARASSRIRTHVYVNPDTVWSGKRKKVADEEFVVPGFSDHMQILLHDYKVKQLKRICEAHTLRKTGNKQQLRFNIYNYLYLSTKVIPFQKIMRGGLVRTLSRLKCMRCRDRCVNETDFLSLDRIAELPYRQFMSVVDDRGTAWGFDIRSVREWLLKSGDALNPYNRCRLPSTMYDNIRRIIRIQSILKIGTDLAVDDYVPDTSQKTIELRVHKMFQTIDEYGNYTDSSWFLRLGRNNLIRFARELYDLWHYRLGLGNSLRRNIVPTGDPFRTINLHQIIHADMDTVKGSVLGVAEKFVYLGIDREHKYLGSTYVLTALTTVSQEAATALPWLYHAVV
jgi:hypothetical protein